MKTPVQGTRMGLRFGEVVAPAAAYGGWLHWLAVELGDFPPGASLFAQQIQQTLSCLGSACFEGRTCSCSAASLTYLSLLVLCRLLCQELRSQGLWLWARRWGAHPLAVRHQEPGSPLAQGLSRPAWAAPAANILIIIKSTRCFTARAPFSLP